MTFAGTVRVTRVRSQNPRGIGGAIFTGVPLRADGAVLSASEYVVVRAAGNVIGGQRVERGQWWSVTGTMAARQLSVNGYQMTERQVEASTAALARPSGEHLITFIAENASFEGIGTVKARRLWDTFGERLYELLDKREVATLSTVLAPDIAHRLVTAWAKQGESQTLQWLQSQGFDVRLGRKLLAYFGSHARERIEEDPYRLLSFAGGWKAVDKLARSQFGVAPDDPRRLQGAVEEACYRMFGKGHTLVQSGQLMNVIAPLLSTSGKRLRDLVSSTLSSGLANGSVVQVPDGLQPLGALVMERQVASSICERLQDVSPALLTPEEVDGLVEDFRVLEGVELNPEQRAAVHEAAKRAFLCVTGGAGVGKTTVLKALYQLYDRVGMRVVQLALAGRAAKRMQEATGRSARTIAAFLQGYEEGQLEDPTVLVVDEASMVDIISMSRICSVLPSHVRLVLVGDPHQLMPVGPGLLLHAVQQVPQVPTVELKTVKRYGAAIADAANAVRAGQWPALGKDRSAPVAFLPCAQRDITDTVLGLLALEKEGTQILCAVRNGPAGTKALNELCQERFTREQSAVKRWNDEFECVEHCGFHLGDAVLCTRNLWTKGLQNGSLGTLVQVEDVPRPIFDEQGNEVGKALAWVEWDDGVRRPLTDDMLDDVELGYAITVHKAQGSQWRRIIVPVTNSRLLDRTLLYTAITRAQRQVLLVGDVEAAQQATLVPPRASTRKVALDHTLRRMLEVHRSPMVATTAEDRRARRTRVAS